MNEPGYALEAVSAAPRNFRRLLTFFTYFRQDGMTGGPFLVSFHGYMSIGQSGVNCRLSRDSARLLEPLHGPSH